MAKFEKSMTKNLGNYQSLHWGVSECDSFEEADKLLIDEAKRIGLSLEDELIGDKIPLKDCVKGD